VHSETMNKTATPQMPLSKNTYKATPTASKATIV